MPPTITDQAESQHRARPAVGESHNIIASLAPHRTAGAG